MTPLLWRALLRHPLRHPWQLGLAILGIALGVAVVLAVDLANASARRSFALAMERISGQATHRLVGDAQGIPEGWYVKMRVERGLRPSAPVVTGYLRNADRPGQLLQILGIDPFAERPFRHPAADLTGGDFDLRAFLVNPEAALLPEALGEQITLKRGDQRLTLKRAGVLVGPELDGLIITDLSTAQTLLGMAGRLSHIDLILPDGSTGERPVEELRAGLPSGLRLERPNQRNHEATILFASCMDANAAVFESLLGTEDAVIADKLVHASIVDGIRLCKAHQYVYKHMDMAHLEEKLQESQEHRFRMIATDGVFSMDGDIAPLDEIVALGEKYNAMVMVDDSHSSGFLGKTGRGTHEMKGVFGKIDVITTTLGKALGGASGGCISGRKEMIDICRQRSRPYLFSNTLAPVIVSASNKVLDVLSESTERRDKLEWSTKYFREQMTKAGINIRAGEHPIVPIMLYNAKLASDFARDMYAEGIYVVGFFFPVVAKGQARIRVQISASHEKEHLDKAIAAFTKIAKKYNILGKTKDEIIAMYGL